MTTALPPMLERDFARQVTDLAAVLGWTWVHFRPAQTRHGWRTPVEGPLGEGWPDLTLVRVRDQRLLFAELKRDGAKPTRAQEYVLGVLRVAGLAVYVWRPGDLEQVAEVLR